MLPAIELSKSVTPNQVLPGEIVTYTASLYNAGIFTVSHTTLTDTLPGRFAYLGMVSGPQPVSSSGQLVVWSDLPPIGPGQTYSLVFRVQALGHWPETYYNELDAASPDASIPARKNLAPVKINHPIGMNKFVSPGEAFVGDLLTYNLSVRNYSPIEWVLASITDLLPTGFYQVGGSNSNPAVITETLPYGIAGGATWYGSFQATISTTIGCSNLPKTYYNEKENIDLYFSAPDPVWAHNISNLAPVQVNPNIQVDLVPYRQQVQRGDILTYTLSLYNVSPTAAADSTITLTLPVKIRYLGMVAGTPPTTVNIINGGQQDQLVWQNFNLAAFAETSMAFTAQVDPTITQGAKKSTFTATSSEVCFGDLGTGPHGLGVGTVNVTDKVISLTKKTLTTPVPPLTLTDFELQIKNIDAYPFNSLVITDVIPPGFTYYEMLLGPQPITVTQNHIIWNNITVPAKTTMKWKVRLQSATLFNTYTNLLQAHSSETIILPAQSTVGVLPVFAMQKETGATTPLMPGSSVPYTITLVNLSASQYLNILVTDTLPVDFTYLNMIQGPAPVRTGLNGGQPVWLVPKILAGASYSLVFNAYINPNAQPGVYYNQFIGSSPSGPVPGPISQAPVTVNGAPLAGDDAFTVSEDSANTTLDVLANDSDFNGNSLTIFSVDTPNQGGTVVNNGSALVYTPALNFNGVETFSYVVTDGYGGFASAAVNVTVTPLNDPPTAVDDVFNVAEDAPDNTLAVLSNDSDIEGDSLSILAAGVPDQGGSLVNTGDALLYTPDSDFTGSETFTYTVSDGVLSDTAAVTVHVLPNPGQPVANNDVFNLPEDSPNNTLTVLANDSDPNGDPLTIVTISTPDQGGTVINGGSVITYTPAPDFNGSETFLYVLADNNGGYDTAVVTLNITPVSEAPTAVDDAYLLGEDSQDNSLDVLANDSDPENDPIAIVNVSLPNHGGTLVYDSGMITYTPAANYFGLETFIYYITDGNGNFDTAQVSISISSLPDAPVAANDIFTLTEDSPATGLDILLNDFDADGDPLSLYALGQPDQGGLLISAGGSITYTPAANFYGTEVFTYTITDGQNGFDTAVVTLTITPANDPPLAASDAFNVNEDSQDTPLDVLANDSDVEGEPLAIIAASAPDQGGTLVVSGGLITYTPAADFYGSETFTYTVTDGSGGFASATVAVQVASINDLPSAADNTYNLAEDSLNNPLNVLANDSDPEDDPLVVFAVGLPDQGGAVVNGGSQVFYTPAANFFGSETFTYTLSDGNGGFDDALVTVYVTPSNDDPLAVADHFALPEDSPSNLLDVLANDLDVDGDTLTIISVGTPDQGGVLTSDGSLLAYLPAPDFTGTETFTYTISDGNNAQSTALVEVELTAGIGDPSANDDAFAVFEDSPNNPLDVLANDSDPDNDPLTIIAVGAPDQGGAVIYNGSMLTYTPAIDFSGVERLVYYITDGSGGFDIAAVAITVTAQVEPPVADDDFFSLDVDSPPSLLDVLANDSSPSGSPLSIVFVSPPDNGGSVVYDSAHITYTPQAGFNGLEQFSYAITDGSGRFDAALVSVVVTPTNHAALAVDDAFNIAEDTPNAPLDVLGNDSDPDGDTLTIVAVGLPDQGGALVNNGDGLSYTPAADFYGGEVFTYTISDGNGGFASAWVTVTVAPVNDPPLAVNDAPSVAEDSQDNSLDVLANDSDVEGETLSIVSLGAPNQGGAVINAGTAITYTPAADFYGTETFTYTVADGSGGFDTAWVTVSVAAINDPPAAAADAFTVSEDSAGSPLDVLDNDTDVEGDALIVFSATQPDQGGSLVVSASGITYTPALDFYGLEIFDYTISDGHGGFDSASVTMTVTPQQDAPLAAGDVYTLTEDSPASALDVLANDSDVDGDGLVIFAAGIPDQGGTLISSSSLLTYTPAADFYGLETFTYTVSDGQGGFSTALVTITLQPQADSPQAAADVFTVDEDSVGNPLQVLANDIDGDGDPLTITAAGLPDQGGQITIGAGFLLYTPAADFHATERFTYTVSDGGLFDSAWVTVTVASLNDPPAAMDDAYTLAEDSPAVALNVLDNDSDPEGNALAVFAVGLPGQGGTLLNGGGWITYTPAVNFSGLEVFTYTVSDGQGGFAGASVAITVTPDSEAPLVSIAVEAGGMEGEPLAFTGSYTATQPVGSLPRLALADSLTWDFGDGSILTGTLTPTHAYQDNGTYTVTLVVTDTLGHAGMERLPVTIANAAPELPSLPALNGAAGQVITLTTVFTDPGILDSHTILIDWGGGVNQTLELAGGVLDFSAGHVYASAGDYAVTLTVIDKDGDADTASFIIHVKQAGFVTYLPLVTKQ